MKHERKNEAVIRTMDELRRRFFPRAEENEASRELMPEDIGRKLARESLDRLQAALTSLKRKAA